MVHNQSSQNSQKITHSRGNMTSPYDIISCRASSPIPFLLQDGSVTTQETDKHCTSLTGDHATGEQRYRSILATTLPGEMYADHMHITPLYVWLCSCNYSSHYP